RTYEIDCCSGSGSGSRGHFPTPFFLSLSQKVSGRVFALRRGPGPEQLHFFEKNHDCHDKLLHAKHRKRTWNDFCQISFVALTATSTQSRKSAFVNTHITLHYFAHSHP